MEWQTFGTGATKTSSLLVYEKINKKKSENVFKISVDLIETPRGNLAFIKMREDFIFCFVQFNVFFF